MFFQFLVVAALSAISSSLVPIKKVYFAGDIHPIEIGPNQNLAGHSPSSVQFCQNTFQMAMTTQLPTEPKTRALLLPRASKFFANDLIVGLTRGYVMFITSPFTSNPVLISLSTPYAVDAVIGVPGTQKFFAGTEQGLYQGIIDLATGSSFVQPIARVQSLHIRPQKPHELLLVSYSWVQQSLHVTNTTIGRYKLSGPVAYSAQIFIPFSPVSLATLQTSGRLEVLALEHTPPLLYSQAGLSSSSGSVRGLVHVPHTDLLIVALTDGLEVSDVYNPGVRRLRQSLSVIRGLSLWNDAFSSPPSFSMTFGSDAMTVRASILAVTFENSDVEIFYLDKECPIGCQSCRFLPEKLQVICDECLPGYRQTADSSLCIGICSTNTDSSHRLELDGSCVQNCPIGFWRSVDNCRKCDKMCGECIGPAPGRCSACNDLNVLTLRGTCSHECGDSEYLPTLDLRKCSACQDNCVKCRNDTSTLESKVACDLCAEKFALIQSAKEDICKPDCQVGEFFDSATSSCAKCSTGCRKCNSAANAGCSECQTGYINHMGNCLTRCPEGYFSSRDLKSCVPCVDNCAQCGSARECLICRPGYLRSAKTLQCTKSCASEEGFYVQDGRFCNPCQSPCQTCEGKSTSCTGCGPGFELRLSSCWETGLWPRLLQRSVVFGGLLLLLLGLVILCRCIRSRPRETLQSVRLPSSEEGPLHAAHRLQTTNRGTAGEGLASEEEKSPIGAAELTRVHVEAEIEGDEQETENNQSDEL